MPAATRDRQVPLEGRLLGHGVDLVEVSVLERAVRRSGAHFLRRVYTTAEVREAHGPRRFRRLAALFAAKEAVLKACGLGLGEGVALSEIEVLVDPGGRAAVSVLRPIDGRASRRRPVKVLVSVSETREYGVAYAVALSGSTGRG